MQLFIIRPRALWRNFWAWKGNNCPTIIPELFWCSMAYTTTSTCKNYNFIIILNETLEAPEKIIIFSSCTIRVPNWDARLGLRVRLAIMDDTTLNNFNEVIVVFINCPLSSIKNPIHSIKIYSHYAILSHCTAALFFSFVPLLFGENQS